jgi:hypothetical protein
MDRWVDITFDCMPLRSIPRLDIPLDASPVYRAFCERVKQAIDTHGTFNTYYLHNAHCIYHLTNRDDLGMLHFAFEGTLFTDEQDQTTIRSDLQIRLVQETCDWLTEPIVQWFEESVSRSVCVEFDRYIAAGDLERARERLSKIQSQIDESGGYLGMYL